MVEAIFNTPIGVFDSGLGGVRVLRQMRYLMPAEHSYIMGIVQMHHMVQGLSKRIRDLTIKHVSRLLDQGCKAIVDCLQYGDQLCDQRASGNVFRYSDCWHRTCDQAGSNRTPGRQYTCDGNTDDVEAAKIQ